MARFADRVKETSTTTGTGTLDLAGAVSGYRTFVAGVGTGNKCYYCIAHQTANEWEVGLGTVTDAATDTLSRDLILSSSNSGSAVSFSAGTKDVFVTIPSVTQPLPTQVVEPISLQQVAGTIASKAGTVTGSSGFGSSLFLRRVLIPSIMAVSEIQAAMSIGFPATNQGAGTMSRYFGLYSFGNSTSLASVVSASGTSAWNTGTSTAGASSSLTQFQGGWSSPLIQPMTFASSTVAPGEYVVAQLFNFAQGSSTWTLNFYGAQGQSTFLASAATNLTSASLAAMSFGGLSAASAFTASSSSSLTAWSAAPTVVNALSSTGLAVGSGITGFGSLATGAAGATFWGVSRASSAVSSVASATSSFTFLNLPLITALSTLAGSILTASASGIALSNAGTIGFAGFMGSGGLLAGSFLTATASLGAVTNVALGALASSTLAQLTLVNFGFIGTGSTTSGFPTAFQMGIMSTGGLPAAITLTSTAVTYSGSFAAQQPWLLMAGA